MQREPEAPDVYSQLAMAYGRKGDLAEADLASSQAALARGDMKTARELAARAKTRFPTGSPGWVKADDIVGLRPPKPGLFSSTNVTFGPVKDRPGQHRTHAMTRLASLLAAAAISLLRRRRASPGAELLGAAARRDREDHPRLPAQAPGSAAGGDGGAREEAADRRSRKGALRDQDPFGSAVQLAAPGRRSAIRRATSPSWSSSITTAATANARSPT